MIDCRNSALCYQGHIWRSGYAKGELLGEVFDDVPEALLQWRSAGRKVLHLMK
jgi:methionine salvage enolase-phosphatase E1